MKKNAKSKDMMAVKIKKQKAQKIVSQKKNNLNLKIIKTV